MQISSGGKISKCVDWELVHGHSVSAEIDRFRLSIEPTVESIGLV